MRAPRPTYGSVTATIALVVALGGTSYAATKVTGADIRNGTVTGADIRDGSLRGRDVSSLTGADVRNASLKSADIEDGSLLASDFAAGQLPVGPPGPAGPAGAKGDQGPRGEGGASRAIARTDDVVVPGDEAASMTVSCDQGEVALGGGAGHSGLPAENVAVLADEPLEGDGTPPEQGETATAWRAYVLNSENEDRIVYMTVLCVRP